MIKVQMLKMEDGTTVTRVLRIRDDGLDPDVLLDDGTWWNVGARHAGECWEFPRGSQHATVAEWPSIDSFARAKMQQEKSA